MKKILNFIIVILIITILGIIGYLVYDKVLNDEERNNVNNNQKVSYDASDYITVEEADFGFETDRLRVEKVVFKNLDVSIVNDFVEEQNKLINNAVNNYNYWASFNFEGMSSEEGVIASSDIWYQINNNILTIYYNMHSEDAIGECDEIAVINIDLESKKLVTNEELLKLAGINFEDIAEEHYNKTLDTVKKCNQDNSFCRVQDKDYNIVKYEDFVRDKDIYIDMIVDGLDKAIDCYIEDGEIKYTYKRYAIDILYLGVGKGGCFDYITIEVGDYK